MQSVYTLLKSAPLRYTGHVTRLPYEHLSKKILCGELQVGTAPLVVRRSDTRTSSKLPLNTSTYQQNCGNRLHRIEQSGEASKKGVLLDTKLKELAKSSRNVLSGMPEQKHHQLSFRQISLVLSATVSLE